MDALQIVCRILSRRGNYVRFRSRQGISHFLDPLEEASQFNVDNLVQGLLVELIEHNNVIDTV